MAVTATALTAGGSTIGASTYDTASLTPSANKLVLIAIARGSGTQAISSVASDGLTWVEVANFTFSAGYEVAVYRAMGASPGTDTITITFAAGVNGVAWVVAEFGGVNTGGTNGSEAVVQSVTNSGTSQTPNATLSAFSSVDNATWAVGATYVGTTQVYTAGTGFTLVNALGAGGGQIDCRDEFRNDNDTTATFATGTNAGWGVVAIELKAVVSAAAMAGRSMTTLGYT